MSSNQLYRLTLDFERKIYLFVGPYSPATAAPHANTGCLYIESGTGDFYVMIAGTWTSISIAGASAPPSGLAGGDLGGSYPSPIVEAIQGSAIASGVPTTGGFLKWASSVWSSALLTVTDIPSLPASKLTATGTQDASHYLRGDNTWATIALFFELGACMDGIAAVLDTTWEAVVKCPVAGTIVEAAIGGNPSGSISIDVYKAASGSFNTWTKISASDPIALSSATDHVDTTLTGWTTAVAAGDWIRFVVTSATTITRAVPALKIQRS